jgi:hypothetical protein
MRGGTRNHAFLKSPHTAAHGFILAVGGSDIRENCVHTPKIQHRPTHCRLDRGLHPEPAARWTISTLLKHNGSELITKLQDDSLGLAPRARSLSKMSPN